MSVEQTWSRAARSFAGFVECLPQDRWDAPALGEWSVRDLVGHTTSAGVREVLAAIDRPAPREDITTAAGYYALAQSVDSATYDAAIAASTNDAHRTGQDLGSDPAQAIHDMVDLAGAELERVDLNALVTTAAGGMRLSTWLPTRSFELAVHSLDIARATEIQGAVPDDVIADAAALAARTAAAIGHGRTLLLAVTGRADLPTGFSIVGRRLGGEW